jgi:hypothetical protein
LCCHKEEKEIRLKDIRRLSVSLKLCASERDAVCRSIG